MNVAVTLVFLSTATVCGFALVRFFGRDLTRSESIAWSFAVGLILQSALELAMFAFGLNPGPGKFLVAEGVLVGLSLLFRNASPRLPAGATGQTRGVLQAALLAGAAAGVLVFFCIALSASPSATDFLAIWGLKGKIIYAAAALPGRLFQDSALAWSHPEYPLLIPLTLASLAAAVRAWDGRALMLLAPFCQSATALALLGFLSRRVSKEAGATAACLCALFFPLYCQGNVGTAEIPLALGLVLATSAAFDASNDASIASRCRLGLACLLCAATKQEGALFALLLGSWLLVRRESRRSAAGIWAILPVLIHALILRLSRGPVVRRDFDPSLVLPSRWPELFARMAMVARHLATVEARHAGLGLALLGLFLLLTRRGVADWLAAPIAAQMVVYGAVCALSAFGPVWLVESAFSRITLTLFPALALVLGARISVPALHEGEGFAA